MAVLDFSDQGVAVDEALDFSDQGDPLPDFSNEGVLVDAETKPERTPEQEAKRAKLLREQKDAQLGGRLADVGVNAARLAEGATEVVRQTNPLTVLPRLAFEADKKLGFVPEDQPNPMDRPVFSVEEVRKGIDFLTSETVEPGSVKEGAKKFTSEFVSGLTHPDLIAAGAAGGASRIASKVTQEIVKVLGPAFAGDVISHAPEAYQDYLQALSGGDKAEITRSALHFTTTVAIPALIAGHARKANRPPPDDLPPLREAELRQQAADTALEATLPLSAKAAGVSGRGTEPVPPGFTTDLGGPIKREPYASEIKASTEVSRPAAVEAPAPAPAPEAPEVPRPQERAGEAVQQEAVVRDIEPKAEPVEAPRKAGIAEPIPTPEESQALGIAPTAHPAIRAIANLFNPTAVGNAVGTVKDFFGGYAGRSMPKITRANRELGEQGVRWASSRIAAKPLADVFSTEVLRNTPQPGRTVSIPGRHGSPGRQIIIHDAASFVDPKKFGTALTEDNLRSVRKGFEDAGDATAASRVHTVIGSKGSPFKTEAEYQAFLADPNTQAAIARYKQLWDAQVEPMYKKAMFIDPAEVLPDRGLQTGARVNLMAVQQTNPNTVQGIGKGNLLGTLKKKSPFGIRAKGTGQSYNGNIRDMVQNTFGRQLEIANKNAFDTKLVETGDAVISKPGEQPIIKDESTVAFPYVRQRVIIPKEGAPPNILSQNRSIYVRKSLAKEYSRASNTETKLTGGPVTQFITSMANRSALAGFTDATVHISNLATVLMTRPAVAGKWWQDAALSATGRADLIPIVGRVISKVFQDNAKQLAELAEIGAARQDPPPSSKLNPMNYLADLIHIADRTTRLVMDDAFKRLVDEGVVRNTETNRREWVNQTGQYNKRLQGKWTAAGRDSGLSPFITAGKNFTTLGVKNVTLNPGVKATNLASAAALRANVAAKWVGLGVLAGTLNYLLTKDKPGGGMMGRPGTPVGDVDSGMDDENGRPLVFPLASVIGLGRGLRVTGIRGYTEAKRKGLPSKVAMDAAVRDMVNSQASLMAGPPVRLAVAGASGYAPAINVGRASPVVPPGESQHLSDIKGALIEANPVLASIHAAHAPGGTIGAGIQKQFPRFTLAPKQPPEMLEKYPEIVRKAQANDYINDVIRRARKMKPEAKMKFLNESVKKLAPEDQRHAWEMFKRRRLLQ